MKEKIRIMYIANDLTVGGAEEIYLLLSKYLNRKFELLFVVIGEKGEIGKEIEKHSRIIVLNLPSRSISFKNKLKAVVRISRICRNFRPDLIHSQLWTGNTIARIVGILTGTPNIIAEQNVYLDRNKIRLIIDKILSYHTKKIIAVSEPVKDFILQKQKISEKKVRIIHNSFDQSKFKIEKSKKFRKELGIKNDFPVVVSVGMLGRLKNQRIILEALSNVTLGFTLLFLGDGPEKDNLKELARELKLNDKVKFLGWRRDVSNVLNASDIFVLSSYTEGLSLSLMEAMFMKKVCLVSNIKSNKVLINKKNGFLFSPDEPNELSEKINFVLDNRRLWGKYGESAKETIIKKFSIQKMIDKYEKLYIKTANF